ncbi:MAG: exodeoxyribonuclease VII small subunit [Erysipelotrichaceae bacterium]|jgi:exodeoxyribonuclease VII small subunit|nr:exodeoxyribonuclease VII small subunit [Erysipelotrichaceae bacterium]
MAKELTFEQQMKKLQDIVEKLESGDVDLDASIKLYEDGLKLSKELKKQLLVFEDKIEKLGQENE